MVKKLPIVKTNLEISQEPNSPVMRLIKETGIEGIALDVIKGIMSPLINLIRSQANDDPTASFDSAFNKSITLIAASDPKNQLELMLATQLAMTHITLGKSAQLLDRNYSQVKSTNSLGNLYTKLSRLGIDQINTLERMKGKGQQKIIVEKINIEAGGQAAIGVYEGGGVNVKKGP
jgi:hypothetical protein